MRTRSTTTDTPSPFTVRVTNLLNNTYADTVRQVEPSSANVRIMEDVITDRFEQRKRSGEIIVNPMVSADSILAGSSALRYDLKQTTASSGNLFAHQRVEVVAGDVGRFRDPGPTIASRYYGGTASRATIVSQFDLSSASAVESSLLARCLSTAASSDALALVTLAELNKTLGLFHDLAQQAIAFDKVIARMTRVDKKFLRKANLRDLRKSALLSAQAWLAYRYGIMATYYDCMSWIEARNSIGKPRRARFVSSTSTDYDSGVSTSVATGLWSVDTVSVRRKRHTISSAGCIVAFDLEGSMAESYGILNLLSSGWELVPYSFILDWFVDIGERLAALEGKFLRPVLGSWITHRHTLFEYRSLDYVGRYHTSGGVIYNSLGMNDFCIRNDTCQLVTRSANPPLSPLPQFKVNLNWKKLVDSIALLSLASKRAKSYR